MRNFTFVLLVVLWVTGCCPGKQDCRQEILDTEKEFEKMAAEKGLAEAFSFYVADSGILNAGDSNFIGKEAVRKRYDRMKLKDAQLRWSPDFVDVSASCDMAYTWGRYTFSYKDSTGKEIVDKGIFHTVWKRQPDGTWRFVWD